VSEYQYYEFLAIDRALSETSSFTNEYHRGDFWGDTTISPTRAGAAAAFSRVCLPPCSQPGPPPAPYALEETLRGWILSRISDLPPLIRHPV
jgi:hypothetical protein